MKVLMFGWEFPPFKSGGLGTACHGLTKGLSHNDVEVTFVMPFDPGTNSTGIKNVKIISADAKYTTKNIKIKKINSLIQGYETFSTYDEKYKHSKTKINSKNGKFSLYGKNLLEEVHRYASGAADLALEEDFDIIHAHDWLTYKAGIAAKNASGKPLVVHIHATEFDRTGGNPNQLVYDIEREGFHCADKIIAVSEYTKSVVVNRYGISPEKVCVVHNAVDKNVEWIEAKKPFPDDTKVVLFLGRLTIQKGPEYFLHSAKMVLEKEDNVKFIIAGSGDMMPKMIELSAELGISKHVLFSGFLRGKDIDRAYKTADLYVMPSVSEPFGITPLESIKNGTPVLISKQSGVSEIITNALKVDFWDVNEMANKIIATLRYPAMHSTLLDNSIDELSRISWNKAAYKCLNVYKNTIRDNYRI